MCCSNQCRARAGRHISRPGKNFPPPVMLFAAKMRESAPAQYRTMAHQENMQSADGKRARYWKRIVLKGA